MMDYQRLQMEKQVLARKLPASAYVFQDINTSKPYILLGAVTNSKNIYTIRIDSLQLGGTIDMNITIHICSSEVLMLIALFALILCVCRHYSIQIVLDKLKLMAPFALTRMDTLILP